MRHRAIFLSLVGIFLAARLPAVLLPVGAAEPTPIVVCYPGGAVNENDARGAMDAMLRVVERLGGWPGKSFTSFFTAEADECKRLMGEKQPGFAITSLGLYLELRAEHYLIPLAQPRIDGSTTERIRVVVRQGKYKGLADLKGKSLGGTVLAEPEFVARIVFAGKYDPASFFVLKPSKHAIRALRALDKGELDAVILNGQQFAGLGSLHLSNPIEAIFTSEEIPLMGVVADDRTGSAADRDRFARALE
ncbi:MAG: sterol transporter periplasmic substrate-binding protein BstB, partial [Gammaproteobacteria bacterium]